MKSKERIESEIKTVALLWNETSTESDPNHPQNLIAGAIYDTLRWARGCRTVAPSDALIKRWKRLAEVR